MGFLIGATARGDTGAAGGSAAARSRRSVRRALKYIKVQFLKFELFILEKNLNMTYAKVIIFHKLGNFSPIYISSHIMYS